MKRKKIRRKKTERNLSVIYLNQYLFHSLISNNLRVNWEGDREREWETGERAREGGQWEREGGEWETHTERG